MVIGGKGPQPVSRQSHALPTPPVNHLPERYTTRVFPVCGDVWQQVRRMTGQG